MSKRRPQKPRNSRLNMQHTSLAKPKVLLFDLGGVIVRWTGIEALSDMTGMSRDKVLETFATSSIFSAYEIGQCDDETFIKELISVFKLGVSPNEARKLWQVWVGETYPETEHALKLLKKNYTIACLSNTNALHWEWLSTHIIIDDYFDHGYASHLIKAAKPNAECYQFPVKDMGVNPSDIWFFDDTQANVDAANALGMTAFHVDRTVGVIPLLKELELL